MKKIISLLLLSVFVFGCQREKSNINQIELGSIKNHTVTLIQAQKVAELYTIFNDYEKTSNNIVSLAKTYAKKSVKEVFAMKWDETVANFYVINFEEGGFMLISGGDRINPILAKSDKGYFKVGKNEDYPPALLDWMLATNEEIKYIRNKNIEPSPSTKMAWGALQKESLATIPPPDGDDPPPGGKPPPPFPGAPPCTVKGEVISNSEIVWPLIESTWGQQVGFNDSLPDMGCSNTGNNKPPAGCEATAMAQIMLFYRHPTRYNWAQMSNSIGTPTAAALMRDIGAFTSMNYKCSGSTMGLNSDRTITKAFRNNFGYSSAVSGSYDYHVVKNEIKNGHPVVLGGYSNWLHTNGHEWVVEGVWETQYYTCTIPDPPYPYPEGFWSNSFTSLHFYVNWGWYGQYNGWYGDFNPNGINYQYGLSMIYNIRP